MDAVYGKQRIEAGTIAAFEAEAWIFHLPLMYNHGKILPMRDNDGFIRVFNKGNLALSDDVMAYHRDG